jgi:hypothetical protein
VENASAKTRNNCYIGFMADIGPDYLAMLKHWRDVALYTGPASCEVTPRRLYFQRMLLRAPGSSLHSDRRGCIGADPG